ncbi:hypothetical protein JKP88DRAFT_338398 [Tribonema minus]|uniref:Uncharacterized protein n=1 Tax=Tribonema minus TaxID=303371 RepID=A0A836C884_9STRA|nr:hypothetical protein JKP88DRAFT_338398 [Tribonema minus]
MSPRWQGLPPEEESFALNDFQRAAISVVIPAKSSTPDAPAQVYHGETVEALVLIRPHGSSGLGTGPPPRRWKTHASRLLADVALRILPAAVPGSSADGAADDSRPPTSPSTPTAAAAAAGTAVTPELRSASEHHRHTGSAFGAEAAAPPPPPPPPPLDDILSSGTREVTLLDPQGDKGGGAHARLLALLPAETRANCLAYLLPHGVDVPEAFMGRPLAFEVLLSTVTKAAQRSGGGAAAAALDARDATDVQHVLEAAWNAPPPPPPVCVQCLLQAFPISSHRLPRRTPAAAAAAAAVAAAAQVLPPLRVRSMAAAVPAGGWQTLVNLRVRNTHPTAPVSLLGMHFHLDATELVELRVGGSRGRGSGGSGGGGVAMEDAVRVVARNAGMQPAQLDLAAVFQATWLEARARNEVVVSVAAPAVAARGRPLGATILVRNASAEARDLVLAFEDPPPPHAPPPLPPPPLAAGGGGPRGSLESLLGVALAGGGGDVAEAAMLALDPALPLGVVAAGGEARVVARFLPLREGLLELPGLCLRERGVGRSTGAVMRPAAQHQVLVVAADGAAPAPQQ